MGNLKLLKEFEFKAWPKTIQKSFNDYFLKAVLLSKGSFNN